MGWDSDNPTATWGGLLGFLYGKEGVEKAFNQSFSDRYYIHRTRQNFPGEGIDTFPNMAKDGAAIVNKVIRFIPGAAISEENDQWIIPLR